MKAIYVLLFVFCYVDCRKTFVPLDKNANLAFINMEGGGGRPPAAPAKAPVPAANNPVAPPPAKPVQPQVTVPVPGPSKPVPVAKPSPVPVAKPVPAAKPAPVPHQVKPVPVNPAPVANPITTPGPGSVKQLVNFYDSQGKASPIRPYSYSQAVKQGKQG